MDTLVRLKRNGSARWTDVRGKTLYEYDPKHGGEIEAYDARTGVHIGVLDIYTGVMIKAPERGRTIDV
ncbi:colicin E3/pyocin S6 family cytotoxin [Intrasporangium flavum]|uniref:colicin E3/pyocin S6 family cytotoxin n=1 Tax=Intrasporangium flavum TaxID=1428657 RepID=UPI001A976510|nr:colicin E3/pyocin S6 family cytotoxin [Intrasporangium flavum]